MQKQNNFREPFAQITWLRRIILCVIQYIAGINFECDCICTEVLGTINRETRRETAIIIRKLKYSKTIHMNLFFYLRTFILNYSFIVILSDHIFCTLFY